MRVKSATSCLAAIVVVLLVVIGFVTPVFVRPPNLADLFNDTSILIMLALGQMVVILTALHRPVGRRQPGADRHDRGAAQAAYPGVPIRC